MRLTKKNSNGVQRLAIGPGNAQCVSISPVVAAAGCSRCYCIAAAAVYKQIDD